MANIFAHRGYSSKYFENSAEAFCACTDLNIYGIENDVQLTKDGEIVVIHDEYLKRLLNVDGFIKEYNLSELREFKYPNGESIITLCEYLDIIKDTSLVSNVELKTTVFQYDGIEEKVYNAFKDYNMLDRLIISSFNHYSLLRFREIDKGIPLAALTATKLIDADRYLLENDLMIYHPLFTTVDNDIINMLKNRGIMTNVWTVNDKLSYEKMIALGVDGIITNYPMLDFN